jgi:HTH-type transcriptional regulator/antitoxin HipB
MPRNSPIGRTAADGARELAARSPEYRAAQAEYERIDELRETHPLAAHLRERRFELGLTQQEVADAAELSQSAFAQFESGADAPDLSTLRKLAAVLDEELLVCFERGDVGQIERVLARLGIRD